MALHQASCPVAATAIRAGPTEANPRPQLPAAPKAAPATTVAVLAISVVYLYHAQAVPGRDRAVPDVAPVLAVRTAAAFGIPVV